MDILDNVVEHKSDGTEMDDDMVLHSSPSGDLLDRRNLSRTNKPISTRYDDIDLESEVKVEEETKVKPKLAFKSKSKGKKNKGEALTPEAALDIVIKERQEFDLECAALRAENDELRAGLEKYKHLSPSKKPQPEVIEKVVVKKILDPNGKKYKEDAEQLNIENSMLREKHREMEELLEQQRLLALEAQQHPISRRKSLTSGNEGAEVSRAQENIKSSQRQKSGSKKKKSEKKSDKKTKKSSREEMIQNSLQPVSKDNCSTFPMLLWKGAILWKIPYNGRGVPERRLVMIKRAPLPSKKAKPVQILVPNEDGNVNKKSKKTEAYIVNPPTIIWANPEKANDLKNARELVLYEGAHVVMGHQSPAFWKSKSRGTPLPPEQFCFSIITNSRSLDLAAESVEEVFAWKNALHMLLVMMSPNKEWAVDNLLRKDPVWHHEELEDHSSKKKKKKRDEAAETVGETSRHYRDEDYEIASRKASEASLKDQMFAATRSADYDKLQSILQTQIPVNLMENENSDTILMIACRAGLDKIAQLCLDYGARNDPHPDFGQTALHCAVESRSYKCARILLETAAASQADSIIANLRDSGDQSPLHMSTNCGDTKMSKILLSHGAKIDAVDSKSRAPLHLCAGAGHKICLSLLLDSGGDMYIDMGDAQGNTPLHYSAENGHLACCRLLLETAANPIARNINQQTPYNLASLRGHQKICLLLLDYQDSTPSSSIHLAYSGGDSFPPRAKLERHVSAPGLSSPQFFQPDQAHSHMYSPYSEQRKAPLELDQCNLPRPHSARTASNGSVGSRDSVSPHQYPHSARERSQTSIGMASDMLSPISARERKTPLFDGLSVNSECSKKNNFLTHTSDQSLQENLQRNIFYNTKAIASIEKVPHSPVSTPNRKTTMHRSTPVSKQQDNSSTKYSSVESSEVDYNAPYEEFEWFNTMWQVYWTEDGYIYYLDTQTQHSQWDDPRVHGLVQYDEITGEMICDATSSDVNVGDNIGENVNEDVRLALKHQDAFLKPKSATPKRDLPRRQKRGNSTKPQKFVVDGADMSPFKTDTDDSASETEGKRFSVPARKTRQLSSKKIPFGSTEGDSSDVDSDIPCRGAGFRKGRSNLRKMDSSDEDSDENSVSVASHAESDRSEPDFRSFVEGSDDERKKLYQDQPIRQTLKKKSAPKEPRSIPVLDRDDVNYTGTQDRELELSAEGSGRWFESNSNSNDGFDIDETVSRMVRPPPGVKPIRTNCFSPDKASLERAQKLQRRVSSGSSPVPSETSSEDNYDRQCESPDQHTDIQTVPDGNDAMMGSMRLESDNEDDDGDDYFDTILTIKKDELASAEKKGRDGSRKKANSDYMSFLSKVEKEVNHSSIIKDEVSLTVTLEDSDWDGSSDNDSSMREKALIEKEKRKKIFDTTQDGAYGVGGNVLPNNEEQVPDVDKLEDVDKPITISHVVDSNGDLHPLKSGGESPTTRLDDDSPTSMEGKVRPYLNFLEAGNTVRQVRRQMEKDNQPKDLIKLMMRMSDDICSSTTTSRTSINSSSAAENVVPSKASPEELSSLKQDERIGKYIKMAVMGVPFGNVEQKMKAEGVCTEDALRVAVALGHGPPPEVRIRRSSSSENRPARKSSVSLVKMHWNTLPPEKLENSVWANIDEDSMEEKDLKELEKLFAASVKSSVSDSKDTHSAPTDPKFQLFVLDARRAQNVVIGLSQFKGHKTHNELLEAVCRLDDQSGILNIDKLQNLVPLLPTFHEAKKMSAAKESQHPAEVFFNVAIDYYPELPRRLSCFITCLTFADTTQSLLEKMKRIIDACNEVISSDSLARILQKMLTVGNLMNEGTYRGQASGFTLDSLVKMVNTKGVDKKTSVLDYVIKSLIERGDERLLNIPETLEVDEETTRLSGRDCTREVDHLLKDFTVLEEESAKALRNELESLAVSDLSQEFTEKIGDFMDYANEKIVEIRKVHSLMDRKIVMVVEYFGEDVGTCETTQIFSVIREFLLCFESSKKAMIARLNRKQRK